MKKTTRAEFISLNSYNELRSLCDSYLTEIAELKQQIAKLENDLEIDVCLRRYQFGDDTN
ncbi:hypothetical protein [Flavobacterium sp.]|uniref:hypothetical protein n=1 Tax=Flavobacterium sp. TaxID=239 RepID=UPI003BCB06AC